MFMKKKIVYIGNFSFPLGNAVAKRVLGIGKALLLAGYDVTYIGESREIALGEISKEMIYEEFKYYNIHKPTSSIEHYLYKADVKNVCKKLKSWKENAEIAAVIFCGTKNAFFANAIVNECKKMKIPTIADSMDWLNSRTGNIIFDIVKQLDTNFELRVLNRKANAVIAISSYLAQYYQRKGLPTVVVPPISPYTSKPVSEKKDDNITFIYAGIPCRLGIPLKNANDAKDRLDLVIRLLYSIHKKGYNYQFYIYGLTKEQYAVVYPDQNLMVEQLVDARKIYFMGFAEEYIVREAIERADYAILLRDNNRVTMAGFPTKVSESISLGTPIITTETSDISTYVREGADGYFLDITDMDSAERKLIRILKGGKNVVEILKKQVRENDNFKPDSYVKTVSWVLDAAIKNIK